MLQLHVPGSQDADSGAAPVPESPSGVLRITAVRSFSIGAARGGEATLGVRAAEDEVTELEFADGLKLWLRADQLGQYFPPQAGRGDRAGSIEIAPSLALGGESRGVVGRLALKALRLFRIDPAADAARRIGAALEAKLHQGGGLFRCAEGSGQLQEAGPMPADRPLLVFIHGTFSSTRGSFGDLWEDPQAGARGALFRAYDGHVYGFEHRSVSETPVRNAIRLAGALPAGARLHLVSHSRGGLVGELLCRSGIEAGQEPLDGADRDCFPDAARRGEVEELNAVLKAKRLRIERFVRVAGPMRGTTLASGRIDRWLSVLTNLLGSVPGFRAAGLHDLLGEFVLAVVRNRTDPASLPGIEAVMPESPLMALINRPGVRVAGALRVIAGDIEESGLWGRLKLLLPDWFYGGEHDLVVNTSSMWGGARRLGGERHFFDQGPNVNHVRYFENEATVNRLVAALTAADPAQDGFAEAAAPATAPIPRSVRRGPATDGPRPVVFLLPGIMGSHLAVGDNRVWVDPLELAFGGMAKLAIDQSGVHAECPMESVYGGLIDYLAQTHEVRPFAYDWRRPIQEEARRLGDEVAAALDEAGRAGQPVRILAHSMGGLVARAMILERPEVWQRLCRHEGGRLLMLGTPNGGSHSMVRALTGRDNLVRGLAALDLRRGRKALLEIIAGFPGVLELLPQGGDHDFFSAATWDALLAGDEQDGAAQWSRPAAERLAAAGRFRQALAASPVDAGRMIYVAGSARATPFELEIADTAPRLRFIATPGGDGRVPWETGRLPGVPTWYMAAEHGDLCRHEPAFEALRELLDLGQTQRLPKLAPVVRGVPERFALEEGGAILYPDGEDLAAAAVGGTRRARRGVRRPLLRLRVAHGNLAFTDKAVAVGHYLGDTLVGGEAYLDRVLKGRLRDRHRLGLYPGAEDSCEVFLNPGGQPGGAIVVGLGRVGSLTPGGLRRAFARAALSYAIALAESAAPEEGTRAAGRIASLLIGTGAGNMTLENSVASLLGGAVDANRLLQESGYGDRVLIEELEILELYEDRAIQALRALRAVAQDPRLAPELAPDLEMHTLDGGRRRAYFEESRDWAQRLQITEQPDGSLRFAALTDRARAEATLQTTQRELIDALVGEAVAGTAEREPIAVTLFELLVPHRLKEAAPDSRDRVLVVDQGAARYPWELLRDRMSPGEEPMAVRAVLVRQLYTERFRERVAMTHRKSALVVGDPPSRFPPLPGAREEAERVAKRLESAGFEVRRSIGKDHRHVLNALYGQDYRLLHLAAHGVYEYPLPGQEPGSARRVSGMVLGDGVILTPAEIEQMRVVPELVFINCCFLGRIAEPELRRSRSGLAANLATQLIEMGVRIVVAAGWEVDDAAAAAFAETFYGQMLAGRPFGQALREARRRAWIDFPSVNTWGAYQGYGDPDFRLGAGAAADGAGEARFDCVAPSEAVVELENIRADAKTADPDQTAALLRRTRSMAAQLPAGWRDGAQVRVALGDAFGELGAFEEAVGHYRRALASEEGAVPLGALDGLCNLQVRWGRELAASGSAEDRQRALDQMDEARVRLERLLELAPSSERWSLLGGTYLRKAALMAAGERWDALARAAESYARAAQRGEGGPGADPYARRNALTARILLLLLGAGRDAAAVQALEGELRQLAAESAAQRANQSDFWSEVAPLDCEVLRGLLAADLDGRAAILVEGYRAADRSFGSPREMRSVLDRLALLGEILTVKPAQRGLQKLVRGLRKIAGALAG